ncbi:hypothetical protein R0J91_13520, partial [Micrococcus sp. SIMBA_131]
GTSWLNFTRFWKLVLKNSDSTSGNAQEQLPKFLLILSIWTAVIETSLTNRGTLDWTTLAFFYAGIWLFSFILHHYLVEWKPAVESGYPKPVKSSPTDGRSIRIGMEGMGRER